MAYRFRVVLPSGRVLEADFASWDQLSRVKEAVKTASWAVFDGETKTWFIVVPSTGRVHLERLYNALERLGYGGTVEDLRAEARRAWRRVGEAVEKAGYAGAYMYRYIADPALYRLVRNMIREGTVEVTTIPIPLEGGDGERTYRHRAVMKAYAFRDAGALLRFATEGLGLENLDDAETLANMDLYIASTLVEKVAGKAGRDRDKRFTLIVRPEKAVIRLTYSPEVARSLEEFTKLHYNKKSFDPVSGEDVYETFVEKIGKARIEGDEIVLEVTPGAAYGIVSKLVAMGYRADEMRDERGETAAEKPKPRPRFEPRGYQEEAVKAWMEAGGRGVVSLPTGAGKTIVALHALSVNPVPALVLVPTRDLVRQWVEKLKDMLGVEAAGVTGQANLSEAERERIRRAPVVVTTYMGVIMAHKNKNWFWEAVKNRPFVIFDEVHHVGAEKLMKASMHLPAPFRLGLSATPERDDGNTHLVFGLVGPKVYDAQYTELAKKGYLAPILIHNVATQLTGQEMDAYERMTDELRWARQMNDRRAAAKLMEARRMLLSLARQKIRKVADIVEEHVSTGSRVMVFVIRVRQGEEILKALSERGIPTGFLTSKVSKKDRARILDDFKAGRLKALIVTQLGDEGIDLPAADVGIIASFYRVPRQFIQRIGRIARPRPGKIGHIYLVYVDPYERRRMGEVGLILSKLYPQKDMARLVEMVKAGRVRHAVEADRVLRKLGEMLEQVLAKRPNLLTVRDIGVLILYRVATRGPHSQLMDVAKSSKVRGKLLRAWVKNPAARDIAVLDTPLARKLSRRIARLWRRSPEKALAFVERLPDTRRPRDLARYLA